MGDLAASRDVFRRIVARTDLDALSDGIFASFAYNPEYEPFRPPDGLLRAWVRWNVDLVIRWSLEGLNPSDGEIEAFRVTARASAVDGMPLELALASYRAAARFAWDEVLKDTKDHERSALLDGAALLFGFIDDVSAAYTQAYQEATGGYGDAEEARDAQQLLDRLCAGEELAAEDYRLAEHLKFDLAKPPQPFLVSLLGRPLSRYTTLAQRLRRRGLLATARGGIVTVLAHGLGDWRELDPEVGDQAVVVAGDVTRHDELRSTLADLRTVLDIGLERGRTGLLSVDDYLPELILRSRPDLAGRLYDGVYGRLGTELAHTLDILVAHDFDRGRSAVAIPVHRNTLTQRIARINAAAGIDLDCADGCAIAWLAWLQRSRGKS